MRVAFAFDLDGTLLDTEMLWVEATLAYLQAHGEAVDAATVTALVYGRSWTDIRTDIGRRYPKAIRSPEAMAGAVRERMLALRESTDCVIHDSVALLRRLAADVPVCVVSGSPREDVEAGVRLAGIDTTIRFLLGAEDYAPGKPDPACYRLAANRLGVDPAHVTVFEDSAAGVRAARAAGMVTVALARPGLPPQDLSPAHVVLESLSAYPAWISHAEEFSPR